MAAKVIESLLVQLTVDSTGMTRGLKQAVAGTDQFEKKVAGLAPKLGMAERALGSMGQALFALGTGAMGFGALATGIKSVISTAADFEQKMSKVKALAGATEADFNRLREAAVKLGSATVFSASEAADGMATLAAAGMSTNEVLSAMPALLAGAAAAGGDFNATANTLVGTLGGFGLAASDSAHVMDVLASAANASRMNITDMGDVFKFTASSAAAYGVNLEQVAASAVIMNNAGLEAGQTGRYLNQVFQQLAKPTDEAGAAMERLGLDFFNAKGAFIGLAPMVDQLKAQLGKLTIEQRQNALATVFGTEASNAMLKLMQAGGPVIEEFARQFEHSDGAAQRMADTMTDNLVGSIEELKGAFESLSIILGSTTLPGLKNATSATAELITETGKLASEVLPLLEAALSKIPGLGFVDRIQRASAEIRLLTASFTALNALRTGDLGKMAAAMINAATAGRALGLPGSGQASGGPISGPGTGTSDSILARVSNGEFVINAASAGKIGLSTLNSLNRFAGGGPVGAATAVNTSKDVFPSQSVALTDEDRRTAELLQQIAALMRILEGVANGTQSMTDAVKDMADNLPSNEGFNNLEAIKTILGGIATGFDNLAGAAGNTLQGIVSPPDVDPATAKLEADVAAMSAMNQQMLEIAKMVGSQQYSGPGGPSSMDLAAGRVDEAAFQLTMEHFEKMGNTTATTSQKLDEFGNAIPGVFENVARGTGGLAGALSGLTVTTTATSAQMAKLDLMFGSALNYELTSGQTDKIDWATLFPNLDPREIQAVTDRWRKEMMGMGAMTIHTTAELFNLIQSQKGLGDQLQRMNEAAGGATSAMMEEERRRNEMENSLFAMGMSAERVRDHMDRMFGTLAVAASAVVNFAGAAQGAASALGRPYSSVGPPGSDRAGAGTDRPGYGAMEAGPALSPATLAAISGAGAVSGAYRGMALDDWTGTRPVGGSYNGDGLYAASGGPARSGGVMGGAIGGVYLDGRLVGQALSGTVSEQMRGTFTGGWRT